MEPLLCGKGVIVKLLLICFCNSDKLTFGLIVGASGGAERVSS